MVCSQIWSATQSRFSTTNGWNEKHAIERSHLLQKILPVHCIRRVHKVDELIAVTLALTDNSYERSQTVIQIQYDCNNTPTTRDLSLTLKATSAASTTFVQVCIPRVFFVQFPELSTELSTYDSLKVGIHKYVGLKTHSPKEYVFQCYRQKQDMQYWLEHVDNLKTLVNSANEAGHLATIFHFNF